MEQQAGRETNGAVFAAEGSARHHLGRVAVAGVAALLAAWVVALALGITGGFDSLPGLPGAHSNATGQAGSSSPHRQEQARAPIAARHTVTQAPAPSPAVPTRSAGQTQRQRSTVKATPQPTTQAPTSTVATPTSHGQSATRTTTTGKPVGSPGNAAGGSGAPGQLR